MHMGLSLQGTPLPPVLAVGGASISGSMVGSHAAPQISADWSAPTAQAHGTVAFNPNSARVTCQAPSINVAATLFTQASNYEAMKAVTSQVTPIVLYFIRQLYRELLPGRARPILAWLYDKP